MDLDYVEIYLDSKDATSANGSDAITDWPLFRFETPISDVMYMKVLEAEIPFSYYVINNTNNAFTLTESGSYPVVIPIGSYTSTSMTTALATALTTASSLLGALTYTCTYSSSSGKFTVSTSGPFTLSSVPVSLQLILGLNATSTTGSSLVFPKVANVTGYNYVYLNSDLLGSVFQTYLPSTATAFPSSKGPQIARIPITSNPGEINYYTDPCPEKWFNIQNLLKLQSLDLYFTTASNQKIQFNGQNFSVKLGLLVNPAVHSRSKQTAANTSTKMVLG